MEDDLQKMDDDLKKNGRLPKKIIKMKKTTSKKMEDDLKKNKKWKTI